MPGNLLSMRDGTVDKIIDVVLNDISNASVFGDVWSEIDRSARYYIVEDWKKKIKEVIKDNE
jgi:hypothetical protein